MCSTHLWYLISLSLDENFTVSYELAINYTPGYSVIIFIEKARADYSVKSYMHLQLYAQVSYSIYSNEYSTRRLQKL